MAGKIATLKHKIRDHTVERGTLVAKTELTRCQLSEVVRGAGNDFIEQPENDPTGIVSVDGDIKLNKCEQACNGLMQEWKYVDVVGHGCWFDREMVDGSVRRTAYKHPRLLPNRSDNLVSAPMSIFAVPFFHFRPIEAPRPATATVTFSTENHHGVA